MFLAYPTMQTEYAIKIRFAASASQWRR